MGTKSVKQNLIRRAVRQFHRPTGLAGRLAGLMMAHRASNRQRNVWVVSLLDVQPPDRILEIGFGPGLAVAELARRATHGRIYGIDHSALMVRQATRRNAVAAREGRVDLRLASIDRLPSFEGPLDAVLAVNSIGFWPDPDKWLGELRGRLRSGGRMALASQPRCPGATAETTAQAAKELEERLTRAGFTRPRVEILPLDPPVACVIAVNPADGER
jgi:SAM-dependent methyltransferase